MKNSNWLEDSLKSASEEVAKWPQWKKDAYRVLPDKETLPKCSKCGKILLKCSCEETDLQK